MHRHLFAHTHQYGNSSILHRYDATSTYGCYIHAITKLSLTIKKPRKELGLSLT